MFVLLLSPELHFLLFLGLMGETFFPGHQQDLYHLQSPCPGENGQKECNNDSCQAPDPFEVDLTCDQKVPQNRRDYCHAKYESALDDDFCAHLFSPLATQRGVFLYNSTNIAFRQINLLFLKIFY